MYVALARTWHGKICEKKGQLIDDFDLPIFKKLPHGLRYQFVV
jgi:hypothetical protein